MAGFLIDATDLSGASYGFTVVKDGVTVNAAPARRLTIPIPGIEGELYQGLEIGPRSMTVRGIVSGSSQADMYSKLLAIEALLIGSFGTAPSNFISPARTEKTLTIQSFGGKKFPNCSYDGMDIEYIGPRAITKDCFVTLKFVQSRPFTVSV